IRRRPQDRRREAVHPSLATRPSRGGLQAVRHPDHRQGRVPDLRLTMACLTRRWAVRFALLGGLCALIGGVPSRLVAADDKDLAQALRAGGLVIVVRHGATLSDQPDTDPLNPENIAAQRQLNDKGKAAAKAFGDALRQIGVRVSRVYTSQFNRAY